jgi:hypothetical protein
MQGLQDVGRGRERETLVVWRGAWEVTKCHVYKFSKVKTP